MNLTDLVPSARETVYIAVSFVVGMAVGGFGLLMAALMVAAGRADDAIENRRG